MFQQEFDKVRQHFDMMAALADRGIVTHDSEMEVSIWTPEAIARAQRVGVGVVRFEVTPRAKGKLTAKHVSLHADDEPLIEFSDMCRKLDVLAMA